mmetsp:Transcript_1027/g.2511  ORF Transcript_1027/g.2511 Transcript_1027/m.2511 type:complete len:145 (-) Transcript_1027:113-547(-)
MKAHVGENEVVKVEQIFTWQHAEDFEPWVPKYITPVAPYPGPTTHAVDDPSVYNNDVDKWSFDMSFADEDDDVGNRQPHYYKAQAKSLSVMAAQNRRWVPARRLAWTNTAGQRKNVRLTCGSIMSMDTVTNAYSHLRTIPNYNP